jgi:hypothetical protein
MRIVVESVENKYEGRTQPSSTMSGHHNDVASSRFFARRTMCFGVVSAIVRWSRAQDNLGSTVGTHILQLKA